MGSPAQEADEEDQGKMPVNRDAAHRVDARIEARVLNLEQRPPPTHDQPRRQRYGLILGGGGDQADPRCRPQASNHAPLVRIRDQDHVLHPGLLERFHHQFGGDRSSLHSARSLSPRAESGEPSGKREAVSENSLKRRCNVPATRASIN